MSIYKLCYLIIKYIFLFTDIFNLLLNLQLISFLFKSFDVFIFVIIIIINIINPTTKNYSVIKLFVPNKVYYINELVVYFKVL